MNACLSAKKFVAAFAILGCSVFNAPVQAQEDADGGVEALRMSSEMVSGIRLVPR